MHISGNIYIYITRSYQKKTIPASRMASPTGIPAGGDIFCNPEPGTSSFWERKKKKSAPEGALCILTSM